MKVIPNKIMKIDINAEKNTSKVFLPNLDSINPPPIDPSMFVVLTMLVKYLKFGRIPPEYKSIAFMPESCWKNCIRQPIQVALLYAESVKHS